MGKMVIFLLLSCFLVLACTEGRTLANKEDEKKLIEGQPRSWRFGNGVGFSFTANEESNEGGNGEKHRKKDHQGGDGGGGIGTRGCGGEGVSNGICEGRGGFGKSGKGKGDSVSYDIASNFYRGGTRPRGGIRVDTGNGMNGGDTSKIEGGGRRKKF